MIYAGAEPIRLLPKSTPSEKKGQGHANCTLQTLLVADARGRGLREGRGYAKLWVGSNANQRRQQRLSSSPCLAPTLGRVQEQGCALQGVPCGPACPYKC